VSFNGSTFTPLMMLHSGPEGVEPAYYWSRHDGIMKIETS